MVARDRVAKNFRPNTPRGWITANDDDDDDNDNDDDYDDDDDDDDDDDELNCSKRNYRNL